MSALQAAVVQVNDQRTSTPTETRVDLIAPLLFYRPMPMTGLHRAYLLIMLRCDMAREPQNILAYPKNGKKININFQLTPHYICSSNGRS